LFTFGKSFDKNMLFNCSKSFDYRDHLPLRIGYQKDNNLPLHAPFNGVSVKRSHESITVFERFWNLGAFPVDVTFELAHSGTMGGYNHKHFHTEFEIEKHLIHVDIIFRGMTRIWQKTVKTFLDGNLHSCGLHAAAAYMGSGSTYWPVRVFTSEYILEFNDKNFYYNPDRIKYYTGDSDFPFKIYYPQTVIPS
jgi:hypothetical protein